MNELVNLRELGTLTAIELDHSKLKEARGTLEISQVAKAVGKGYQLIWQIEKGTANPSAIVLLRMMILYGLKVEDVIALPCNSEAPEDAEVGLAPTTS